MISNFVKMTVASAVLCTGVANAHVFRRAAIVTEPVQYVLVPSDSCGCSWVQLRVDESRGTVSSRKVEIKRERNVIKRRGVEIKEFPPIKEEPVKPEAAPAKAAPEQPKEDKPSILVMAGDLPIVK